jgi:hypothetical protein
VADGSVLAYSCAAARDLHPLPCLRQAAKTRTPTRLQRSEQRWMNVTVDIARSQIPFNPLKWEENLQHLAQHALRPILSVSISPEHRTAARESHSAGSRSQAGSRRLCSYRDKQYLPGGDREAHSYARGMLVRARCRPAAIPRRSMPCQVRSSIRSLPPFHAWLLRH